MATKSLGRSIIECGRPASSQMDRRLRAKGYRRWKLDEDGEYVPGPRKGEREQLSDDLGTLERWLKSRVGQPWDEVYSEFCQKEDRRTVRGHHIHTHLIRDMVNVDSLPEVGWRHPSFHVRDGVLVYEKWKYQAPAPDPRIKQFSDWIGDRRFWEGDVHRLVWAQQMGRKSLTRPGKLDLYWGMGTWVSRKDMDFIRSFPTWIWERYVLADSERAR